MTDKPRIYTLEESIAFRPLDLDLPNEQVTSLREEVEEQIDTEAETIDTINCNIEPFVPEGWSIAEHKTGGLWRFDPGKVELYLSGEQCSGKCVKGYELRKKLENKPVLNANVLDRLLDHPALIPNEWKDKVVFFWGTVYCSRGGRLYVRYLYRTGAKWRWGSHWLGDFWSDYYPAAVRAS